jgi:hypothetical protein
MHCRSSARKVAKSGNGGVEDTTLYVVQTSRSILTRYYIDLSMAHNSCRHRRNAGNVDIHSINTMVYRGWDMIGVSLLEYQVQAEELSSVRTKNSGSFQSYPKLKHKSDQKRSSSSSTRDINRNKHPKNTRDPRNPYIAHVLKHLIVCSTSPGESAGSWRKARCRRSCS